MWWGAFTIPLPHSARISLIKNVTFDRVDNCPLAGKSGFMDERTFGGRNRILSCQEFIPQLMDSKVDNHPWPLVDIQV